MLLFAAAALANPWSTSLDDLDPAFRPRVERLLTALRADGYTPVVSNTWRDPRVQDVLAATGRATQAKGGESCHNRVGAGGAAAARAVDIWSHPLDVALILGVHSRLEPEVAFLRDLGKRAKEAGLRWGGDWHGRESVWGEWGLGWDPGHVEFGRCLGLRRVTGN